jgi:hypothetical protein
MEVYELNATKKRKQPIKNANGKNEWPQSPVGNRFKGMEVNALADFTGRHSPWANEMNLVACSR